MTGSLQVIGFLFAWVLCWGIGCSLIDAGLINAGVYLFEGHKVGTLPPSSSGACFGVEVGSGYIGAGRGPSPRSADPLGPLCRVDQRVGHPGSRQHGLRHRITPAARLRPANWLFGSGSGNRIHSPKALLRDEHRQQGALQCHHDKLVVHGTRSGAAAAGLGGAAPAD
jgi:hypothetical protein